MESVSSSARQTPGRQQPAVGPTPSSSSAFSPWRDRRPGSTLLALLVGGLLGLSGCSGVAPNPDQPKNELDARPAWIDRHPEDPQFPRNRYLTGIGAGDASGGGNARILAEEQARAEISRIIQTEIRSELETYMEAITSNDSFLNKEAIRETIESTTESELRGSEVVRSWQDPGTKRVWVKVALAKNKYAQLLVNEVTSGLAQIRTARATAADASNPGAQLPHLLVAYQQTTVHLGKLAQLAAVVDREGPAMRASRTELLELATQSLADISQIGSAIEMSVVAGDQQSGLPGGALPEPIIVRTLANGQGLAGFPIHFSFYGTNARDGLEATPLTASDGTATCRVQRIPTGGIPTPRVVARLDYASFAPDFPSHLVPTASAQFDLPTLDGARVVLVIEEQNGRETNSSGVVRGKLAELLNRKGARLIQGGQPNRVLLSGTDGLARLQTEGVQFLVRGRVRAVPRPKQTFFFSYAGGTIEWLDVSTGAVFTSVHVEPNGSIKGADVNTQSQAGVKALTTLGNHMAQELKQKLAELFAD